jgi:hypothetical protein
MRHPMCHPKTFVLPVTCLPKMGVGDVVTYSHYYEALHARAHVKGFIRKTASSCVMCHPWEES